MTIHNYYGTVLKEYLTGVSTLSNEVIEVLQREGRLEKVLIQMVAEDSIDCEDGGKEVVREMMPYEVDSIIFNLLKTWIDERLKKVKDFVDRAKEMETWNPKSKTGPYTQSSVEMLMLVEEAVGDFFEIPIGISDDLVQELADGLESLFQDYISLVSLCRSKQSYILTIPPLTRCNKDSKFLKLWRKESHCRVGTEESHKGGSANDHHPRPFTSRGTQRLYIHLNTLHHILFKLHSLDKYLSQCPCQNPSPHNQYSSSRKHLSASPSYFDLARSSIQIASQHVKEVVVFCLIFLDSNTAFYDSLYGLTLSLLQATQTLAPALFMILLAEGSTRIFLKLDHEMILEDFESLKRIFCLYGEGLVAEEVVDKEAKIVEGVVELMGQPTDQLVEDFSIAACEASGMGMIGTRQKLPMPPTTRRWNRADANTILRVLCYRNDIVANRFLKTTFQLAKRR
ncbi:hypothetical protein GIB67_006439 [Kingdonia uniflora]|uniref:MHD2 domain-containing protein n=1 Tax=Kingdonia uniflora TaxID=39325 RepID=A0A7J7NE81_9MAGN|nr:hypothetical protein GIB67_006439 [Kingdonia uniflora]